MEPDPRFPFDMNVARAQLQQTLEVREWLSALNESLNRIQSLKAQIATVQRLLAADPTEPGAVQNAAYKPGSPASPTSGSLGWKPVLEQARALQHKLTVFEEKVYNAQAPTDAAGRLHYLARFQDLLQGAFRAVSMPYNQAPSPMVQAELADCRKQLDAYLAEFNELLKTDVAGFNKLALEKGASTLFAGNPIELKAGAPTTVGR